MNTIPVSHVISAQTRARFFFSLSLQDGSVIDSCFGATPVQCTPGDGNLLPAFDSCLLGLRVGDKRQFVVPAEDAFGKRQDANLKRIPRERFSQDIELIEGLVVSFAAAEGGELPGVIHRLMGEMVEVDFNHPLAGRDIVFDVEIVDVENADQAR